jgi:hypothetical protein
MKRLFLFGVLFLFCSLAIISGANLARQQRKPIVPQPEGVSIINLIATPERYDGKMISVAGFLAIENEDSRLYLSQEDYRRNLMINGIFVDHSEEIHKDIEQKDLHYVLITGIFKLRGLPMHYPGGAGDAGITDIRQCIPIPELTDTRPRQLKQPPSNN